MIKTPSSSEWNSNYSKTGSIPFQQAYLCTDY